MVNEAKEERAPELVRIKEYKNVNFSKIYKNFFSLNTIWFLITKVKEMIKEKVKAKRSKNLLVKVKKINKKSIL